MAGHLVDKNSVRLKKRVTLVGAVINLCLSAIKIGAGILGQSAALVADGFHSLSDLVSDVFVLIAVKLGSREADSEHPYGHRRFETIATVMLGLGLIAVAIGIGFDSVESLMYPSALMVPAELALAAAVISILANEWLFQYTKRYAKLTRSKLLMANAWHHRSDALSSVVVSIGIIAVYFGCYYADAVAAILVSLMIAKIGFGLMFESLKELVDSSLPTSDVTAIRQLILATEGVQGIHFLRTRQMGEDGLVDAHIVVDSRISVSEGHHIGDQVRDQLKQQFDHIVDVLVHVDPENDQQLPKKKVLSRHQVISIVAAHFGHFNKYIINVNLHYLESLLDLEITLAKSVKDDQAILAQIKTQSASLQQEQKEINKVTILVEL